MTYSDPNHGHLGIIYEAAGWLYTGLSDSTPLYDLGDGKPLHSRTLSQLLGTHSVRHFARAGINVKQVTTLAKHWYVYFLDSSWRERLRVEPLPYPKERALDAAR